VIEELIEGLSTFITSLGYKTFSIGQWSNKTVPCVVIGDNSYIQLPNKDKPYLDTLCRLHIFSKGNVHQIVDDIIGNKDSIVVTGYDVVAVNINNYINMQDGQITHGVLELNIKVM
jgi:hypothetical protein